MREPPTKVRVLGHPLVAVPVLGGCAILLFAVFQNPEAWPLGIVALIVGLLTMKAQDTANQYRRWRKAWDSMEPSAPASPMPRLAAAIIAVLVVGGFVLADQGGTAGPAGGGQALVGLIVLGLPMVGVVLLARRWLRGRSRDGKTAAVTPVRVVARGPVFPVPSLEAAYRSLPEHSQRAMRS